MRRVEFLVGADVPSRQAGWMALRDAIRSQWAQMDRKRFLGPVAIGFTWRTLASRWKHLGGPLTYNRYGRVWCLLAKAVVPLIGGEPYLGTSRFIKCSDEELAQLRLVIEGE